MSSDSFLVKKIGSVSMAIPELCCSDPKVWTNFAARSCWADSTTSRSLLASQLTIVKQKIRLVKNILSTALSSAQDKKLSTFNSS